MKSTTMCLIGAVVCACTAPEAAVIRPALMFTVGSETGLTAPRDLTVDAAGNILVFDYDDYVIRTFSPSGAVVATFGGPEGSEDGFRHLMAVRALGDSVLALDAGALAVYDPSGTRRSTRTFADTVVCDLPRIHPNGHWAGERIVEETAEKMLTYRDPSGAELSRIAGYGLGEFFPGVQPGGMFFINPTQLRSYVYDFLPDGRLVWAVSDEARVFVNGDRERTPVFSADWHARPFPERDILAMRERQAGLQPPLFMNVPDHYQLIQHLLVDESGDIWLYITSVERTGFVQLSDHGLEKGFYAVEAEFDLLTARVTATHGRLYFMVVGRNGTSFYSADRS